MKGSEDPMFGVLLSPSLLKDRRTNSDTDNKDYGASGVIYGIRLPEVLSRQ